MQIPLKIRNKGVKVCPKRGWKQGDFIDQILKWKLINILLYLGYLLEQCVKAWWFFRIPFNSWWIFLKNNNIQPKKNWEKNYQMTKNSPQKLLNKMVENLVKCKLNMIKIPRGALLKDFLVMILINHND